MPDDLFFGQPITQTALPRCIAIDICNENLYIDCSEMKENFCPLKQ